MSDLWDRVEPLLREVERPARYIDGEWGAAHRPEPAYVAALVYPDTYEIGMANQGLAILYERLNALSGVAAERAYLPWKDMAAAMRRAGVPLFTLESCRPLTACDLVGITLPYELTYTNVLEALDLAGIPLRAAERTVADPIVVGGGPCVWDPEPMAPFFDAILIGEGEEAVAEIVDAHRAAKEAGASRAEVLEALAAVPGVYVPSLYASADDGSPLEARPPAPAVVVKRAVRDLDAMPVVTCPVVPFMDVVHDRLTVEVLRGCTRGCRFCQAGMVYRPVRERTPDAIVGAVTDGLACTGYEEVSLTSLSTTDHSRLEEVLRRLTRRLEGTATSISLPSLRVDAFSVRMARLVSAAKKSGLTFAPEAGTQRLRDVINKNVTEDDLLETVEAAFREGWRRVKLYFMIGLPTETDEDVRAIGALVGRVVETAREAAGTDRGAVKVAVSVSTFVPKAQTPFQWEAQITREEVARRQALLRGSVPRKGVDLSWHDAEQSYLEGVLARGGREVADAVEAAWRGGGAFSAWTEEFDFGVWERALAACGVDGTSIANRERIVGEPLPWAHLSAGVAEAYLHAERERAYAGETTSDCAAGPCTGCAVCGDLGVDVVTAGERRG
ncbi:MAG: B12-binding domain-containing radical SAM protein [Coriobacteriaceae bacterium]|nr:B12-binding domain-containing radical SAM protein [Coriobacteriaceae bacterium]